MKDHQIDHSYFHAFSLALRSRGRLQCTWLTSQRVTVHCPSRLGSFERHPGFGSLMNNTKLFASQATRQQYAALRIFSRYTAAEIQREINQMNSFLPAENNKSREVLWTTMVILFRPVQICQYTAIPWERVRRTLHYENTKKQRNRNHIGLWRFRSEMPDFKRQKCHFPKRMYFLLERISLVQIKIWRIDRVEIFQPAVITTMQKFQIIFITFLNCRL